MNFKYKKLEDKESRKKHSQNLIAQFPDKLPIILEKDPSCKLTELQKTKFLLEKKSTVQQLMQMIRRKTSLKEEDALFLQVRAKFSIMGEKTIQEIYDELEIKGTSDDEIAKLKANKLQILVDNHALVKDYIDNIDLFAKIFAINYHDDMYSLYLYYNYFKNSSIKDNYENIVNHYHYKTCDFHEWFESKYNIMNDQEQDATEADLDTKNYFIKEIFKDMSKRTFQQNYENVKDIIKRLNIKYVEDSNRHYKIGACDNPSCDGNIYHYNEHVVCNMCQRVYCPKCRKEIYPELVERMIDYQIELIPNPLYSKYTDEQKKEKHVCKQEDIDQVRLLTENIKKCPNPECREPIYKDGGCDHMWCSKCHTMFNWSTGEITKTTTNPHYFQWLRQTGQTVPRYNHPDADPYHNCNEQLNREQCNRIIDRYVKDDLIKFKNFASNIELKMIENNNDEMSAARAEYAYGIIDDKEFANTFQLIIWINSLLIIIILLLLIQLV